MNLGRKIIKSLAGIALLAALAAGVVLFSAARAYAEEDEALTGYAWQKVGDANASVCMYSIGSGKLLVSGTSGNAVIVYTETGATSDFGYAVLSAYVVSEGDFFFSENSGGSYYLRRCTNGVVSDPMTCEISDPRRLAGKGNDVYAFYRELANYDSVSNTWKKINIDSSLATATFTSGQCTSGFLYLPGKYGTGTSGKAILYRYDRTAGTWENLSPDAVNPTGSATFSSKCMWAMDDDSVIMIVFSNSGYRNTVYSYKNGQWGQERTVGLGLNKPLSGTYVNGNSILGSGILINSEGEHHFFNGEGWVDFSGPPDLGTISDTNVCAGTDGSIYSYVSDGTYLSIYKLVSAVAADETPPVITTSAADGTVSSSSYTFTVKAEDAVDGVVTPTVKLGGENGTVLTGTAQGDGGYSYTATLAQGANTIYIEASDESGNKATATFTVTYDPAADTTAPQFITGYPKAENITSTGFDLLIKLDEPGTAYYRVVAAGADPGTGYAGWTTVAIPGTGTVSASVYGLTADTSYDLYVIAKDTAGNWQAAPVKLDVTTQGSAQTGFSVERVGSGGFTHGGVASVTVKMTNNTGASQQATLILCLYDNTSKSMENYAYASGEVAAGAQVEITTEGFSIPASGDYSVRAFVWDSFEGMRPLLDSPLQLEIN